MNKAIIGFVKTDFKDKILYRIKLDEFNKIAKALGYEVVDEIIQTNSKIDSSYVFGKGKIEELKFLINEYGVDSLLIYNVLNSMQKINLEDYLSVKVLDRYDLILEIFELNAGDSISKLQIELARIERMIPYVRKRASIMYFRDRPGPRSLGEYAYHKTIAQLTSRKKRIKEKLEKYRLFKKIQREKRKELNIPIVALCGFYGAGKTTLFNALTNLNKEVKGIPFTTLSSKNYMIKREGKSLIIMDTIGFAFDIDPLIIKSFEVTLEDLKEANLNLLVLDASDDEIVFEEKIKTNLNILRELEIEDKKIIPILNKTDLIDKEDLMNKIKITKNYFVNESIHISAYYKYNLDMLIKKILNFIS